MGNLWQDQDASGGNRIGPNSTTAIGKPLVAAFLSHLEVGWRFQVSMHPIFPSRRGAIYEEDKFYSDLMIVI